jgi:hypothetical protein
MARGDPALGLPLVVYRTGDDVHYLSTRAAVMHAHGLRLVNVTREMNVHVVPDPIAGAPTVRGREPAERMMTERD